MCRHSIPVLPRYCSRTHSSSKHEAPSTLDKSNLQTLSSEIWHPEQLNTMQDRRLQLAVLDDYKACHR